MGNTTSEDSAEGAMPMVNVVKVRRASNPTGLACRYHLESERSFLDDYKVCSEVLGTGLGGDVLVAQSLQDDRRYAVKTLSKQSSQHNKVLQLISEVEIHLSLDHPNIAQVKDVYESETSISMVTECCEGGELYASLQEKGIYSNSEAVEVARQMVGVLQHLHARSIVHRDLKLENFLWQGKHPHQQLDKYLQESNFNSTRAEAPQLKLIDFGFARVWDPSRLMTTACGSAEYVSPDILCGEGYTDKTDLWSIGVIVWMLLTGYPPFHGHKKDMMSKIKQGKPDWSHQSRWNDVSQDAKDFVKKLLVKDSSMRIDAYTALQHPWLKIAQPSFDSFWPSERTVFAMQRYACASKMRRAALQILVRQLDFDETQQLRAAFVSMDRNQKGWITVQDVQSLMQDLEQSSNESPFQQEDFKSPEELFAAIDANGDQRIYYSEFAAAVASICCEDHKRALKATFARLDVDGSGSIGFSDIVSTLGNVVEGTDAAELLREVRPQGGEIYFEDFVEAITCSPSGEDADAISPSGKVCKYKLTIFANADQASPVGDKV